MHGQRSQTGADQTRRNIDATSARLGQQVGNKNEHGKQDAHREATEGPADQDDTQHKQQGRQPNHMLQVQRSTQTERLLDQTGGHDLYKVQQTGTHDKSVPKQKRQAGR